MASACGECGSRNHSRRRHTASGAAAHHRRHLIRMNAVLREVCGPGTEFWRRCVEDPIARSEAATEALRRLMDAAP